MATPVIKKMQKPCTIAIKHDGKKIFKKKFETASDLLLYLWGTPLDNEVTVSFAKSVYQKK